MMNEKKKGDAAESVYYVPQAILFEILFRLPVKSLIRLKVVHSSWFSLISSREFCLAHLRNHGRHQYGLVQAQNLKTPNYCLSLSLMGHHKQVLEIQNPYQRLSIYNSSIHTDYVELLGSYNGLLFLSIGPVDFDFILWNPSTRQHKRFRRDKFRESHDFIAGIAHQTCNDDYKVIIGTLKSGLLEVEIYNLTTCRWEIEINHHFPYKFLSSISGTTLPNGKPHWPVSRLGNNQSVILSFDLAQNQFNEVPGPADLSKFYFLSTLYEYLCAGVVCFESQQLNIWVMREYGVEKSWIKLNISFPKRFSLLKPTMPIGFASKDQVIMVLSGIELAVYNTSTNQYNSVFFCKDSRPPTLMVMKYVESLVFPKSLDFKQEEEFLRKSIVVAGLGLEVGP